MAVVFEVKKEIPADIAEGQNCLVCLANWAATVDAVNRPGNGNSLGLRKGAYADNWKCNSEAYLDLSLSSIRLARRTESPIGAAGQAKELQLHACRRH